MRGLTREERDLLQELAAPTPEHWAITEDEWLALRVCTVTP